MEVNTYLVCGHLGSCFLDPRISKQTPKPKLTSCIEVWYGKRVQAVETTYQKPRCLFISMLHRVSFWSTRLLLEKG